MGIDHARHDQVAADVDDIIGFTGNVSRRGALTQGCDHTIFDMDPAVGDLPHLRVNGQDAGIGQKGHASTGRTAH